MRPKEIVLILALIIFVSCTQQPKAEKEGVESMYAEEEAIIAETQAFLAEKSYLEGDEI